MIGEDRALQARLACLWALAGSPGRMWAGKIEREASQEFGQLPTGAVKFPLDNKLIVRHPQDRDGSGPYTILKEDRGELRRALNRGIKAGLILN